MPCMMPWVARLISWTAELIEEGEGWASALSGSPEPRGELSLQFGARSERGLDEEATENKSAWGQRHLQALGGACRA